MVQRDNDVRAVAAVWIPCRTVGRWTTGNTIDVCPAAIPEHSTSDQAAGLPTNDGVHERQLRVVVEALDGLDAGKREIVRDLIADAARVALDGSHHDVVPHEGIGERRDLEPVLTEVQLHGQHQLSLRRLVAPIEAGVLRVVLPQDERNVREVRPPLRVRRQDPGVSDALDHCMRRVDHVALGVVLAPVISPALLSVDALTARDVVMEGTTLIRAQDDTLVGVHVARMPPWCVGWPPRLPRRSPC